MEAGMETGIILFWAAAAVLSGFVALTLLRAAGRAGEAEGGSDVAVYRDQLAEVERDVARGVIAPAEAEAARTEIARRLLAADRARDAGDPAGGALRAGGGRAVAAGAAFLAAGGALALYAWLGQPGYPDIPVSFRLERAAAVHAARPAQAAFLEARGRVSEPLPADPDAAARIGALREGAAGGGAEALVALARAEFEAGNVVAAAAAQERLVRGKGDAATPADQAFLAYLMVLAAEGYVSPEAEAAAEAVLAADPENGLALYLRGAMHEQTLRPDLAFRDWRTALETSPEGAPWTGVIRARIGAVAEAAGVRYTPPAAAGPSAADIAAAGEMSAEERTEMIRGMVEGLAARLASDGGTGAEWAQLIRALGVLGETERARAIWDEAQDVFAASPDDLTLVAAAAREAGVAE
jgi:cytochrome c-type biogenesis protein CcmH